MTYKDRLCKATESSKYTPTHLGFFLKSLCVLNTSYTVKVSEQLNRKRPYEHDFTIFKTIFKPPKPTLSPQTPHLLSHMANNYENHIANKRTAKISASGMELPSSARRTAIPDNAGRSALSQQQLRTFSSYFFHSSIRYRFWCHFITTFFV